ncbi:MAG: non-homologous end-joining DNA ligase [Candidatus Eremiobacteraeota bacterium]|nr:non-homologous end-joining DNA ligase [Candidatus Eremiobacteraeota bacterium]
MQDRQEEIAGVRLTHPERELYPGVGLTKWDLARYYNQVGQRILPHLEGRALTLVRCPSGIEQGCFYQKHESKGLPPSVGTVSIQEKNGSGTYLFIKDLTGLLSLVQMDTLEFHPWGARHDRLERPDRMIFDLDPGPELNLSEVSGAALAVRDLLAELELQSFARLTGGKGIHVVVPLLRNHDWDQVKAFAKGVAERLAQAEPERYTTNPRKSERQGRIFVDYLRNSRGATSVASYSSRARAGAPLAWPVSWAELESGNSSTRTVADILDQDLPEDPWRDFFSLRQGLKKKARESL